MATAATPPAFLTARARSPIDYWHLLSLDAPTVAVLWSYAFSRIAHVRFDVSSALFIAFGTWILYVADRILDGIGPVDSARLQERHHFHGRHRAAFAGGAIIATGALAWITVRYLSEPTLRGFSLIVLAVIVYLALVHGGPHIGERWFPKKLAVGVIFAAGVAVPAWSHLSAKSPFAPAYSGAPALEFAAAVALFAALCWLDCIAIEAWEQPPVDAPAKGGLPQSSRRVRIVAGAVAAVGAVLSMTSPRAHVWVLPDTRGGGSGGTLIRPAVFLCMAGSASVLWLLDVRGQKHLSPGQLRIAADAALLTPLILLLLPGR